MQDKCRTLFLLSHIQEQRLTFIDTLLAALDKLDFSVKYPIQERYYTLLFYSLLKALKTLNLKKGADLNLHSLSKVFLYAFAGLSSKLEIIQKVCSLILDMFKTQYKCATLKELLQADSSYYFNYILSKVRSVGLYTSTAQNRQLLQSLKSLGAEAPEMLADGKVISDLLQHTIVNIDRSVCSLD